MQRDLASGVGARRGLRLLLEPRAPNPHKRARMEEEHGGALVRTVRTVVWRRQGADGMEIVTIVPWEVIETPPYELQDYPEDE